ncbi:hypothetical protein FOZ60_005163 [Perkinsus olseni]|uniref:Uncharacterized protein n=1 Tax=Perkinsus olseni TaxID=32597 RepID=A0A7J6PGJ7_PEROL|nr:hypothetical protein FOZ60_005163 [Perkinsus olseni]
MSYRIIPLLLGILSTSMGEQVIVPLDCLTFCDYVGDGICTKTGQTRVGCRCKIFPQRCRDMYYVNTPHRKGPLEICLSNTKNVDCDRLPNTPVYCNCSSGAVVSVRDGCGVHQVDSYEWGLAFTARWATVSGGAISTIRSHGDSGKGKDSDEQQQWDQADAPSSTRETTVGTVPPSTISIETATPPSEGVLAGTATPSSDDRSTPGPTPWPAGFKQLVCPSMDACSISLYVPRSSASTLIAHPIYKNGRRVMSGFGQEVNFGFSGPQGRRKAPTQEGEILSEDPLNPVVVKVFTYAPYSLSVGSYDLVLFGNDHSTGQYVGQLVVIDLNYCLKEGDNETLFNRLVTYSNDVASDDHDGFIYPTTQPFMPAPEPPAPAPSVQPAPPTSLTLGKSLLAKRIIVILVRVSVVGKKEEERNLVGATAAAMDPDEQTLDDNCIDLESVDPLELLDISAPIAPCTFGGALPQSRCVHAFHCMLFSCCCSIRVHQ